MPPFDNVRPLELFYLRKMRDSDECLVGFMYDPESDFDYYESIIAENGDVLEAKTKILKKIGDLESYYPPALEGVDADKILNYTICYIAGDFIVRKQDEITQVLLPIKYEVKEK